MGIQKITKSQLDRKRSNKSVLEKIREFKGLVNQIEQQKLQFMGHIMRHRCIDDDLLTGMVSGKRSRRREKIRLTNTVSERLGLTMIEAITTAKRQKN